MSSVRYELAVEVVPARGAGEVRASAFAHSDRVVIAVASGPAAQPTIDAVRDAVARAPTADWCSLIEGLAGGHAAVIVLVGPLGIIGASVGDCGAWIVGDEIDDLTYAQHSLAIEFNAWPLGSATLLVASAGLWRHARRADIERLVKQADLRAAARALVDLVRLPSGELQADVAIVMCRG